MAKPGRPRKPRNLKLIQGTYRKDRDVANPPDPAPKIPPRPSHLGKGVPWGRQSVREWKYYAPLLAKNGLLTELDRAILENFTDALGRRWHYRRMIKEHGDVQTTESGYLSQTPYATLYNKAVEDVGKYAAKLGCDPSSRSGINVERPEKSGNAFEKIG